uniref:Uncharacterized protein n=1 Tax=Arundo donax TaxID=35708 RepID=A0A0A9A8T1_ARUDO
MIMKIRLRQLPNVHLRMQFQNNLTNYTSGLVARRCLGYLSYDSAW